MVPSFLLHIYAVCVSDMKASVLKFDRPVKQEGAKIYENLDKVRGEADSRTDLF